MLIRSTSSSLRNQPFLHVVGQLSPPTSLFSSFSSLSCFLSTNPIPSSLQSHQHQISSTLPPIGRRSYTVSLQDYLGKKMLPVTVNSLTYVLLKPLLQSTCLSFCESLPLSLAISLPRFLSTPRRTFGRLPSHSQRLLLSAKYLRESIPTRYANMVRASELLPFTGIFLSIFDHFFIPVSSLNLQIRPLWLRFSRCGPRLLRN